MPIDQISWTEIVNIGIKNEDLVFSNGKEEKFLKNKDLFIGFNGKKEKPHSILIKNNNLHIEISIDPNDQVGKFDKASISDIVVESAVSTIVDNETQLLQLMQGTR